MATDKYKEGSVTASRMPDYDACLPNFPHDEFEPNWTCRKLQRIQLILPGSVPGQSR